MLCKNLNIQTIPAFSPQAKGRVERLNQTHQNRLIPKLGLNNIKTIRDANKYIKAYSNTIVAIFYYFFRNV